MKLVVIFVAVNLAQSAKLDRVYLPPNAQAASGSGNFLRTPYQSSNEHQDADTKSFSDSPFSRTNDYSPNAYMASFSRTKDYSQDQDAHSRGFSNTPFSSTNSYSQDKVANAKVLSNTPFSRTNDYSQDQGADAKGFSDTSFSRTNDYSQDQDAQNRGFSDTPFSRTNDYSQDQGAGGKGFSDTSFSRTYDYSQNAYTALDSRTERAQAALERTAAILHQDSSNDGETYSYAYETENGIYAEESGVATNGVQAHGSYSYRGDDGKVYTVRYTADENGFVPLGGHIPPVPEAILKALEKNARDEAAGIYDDGSYKETKYSAVRDSQYQNFDKNAQSNHNDNSISANSANSAEHRNDAFNGNSAQRAYLPPTQESTNRRNYNSREGHRIY